METFLPLEVQGSLRQQKWWNDDIPEGKRQKNMGEFNVFSKGRRNERKLYFNSFIQLTVIKLLLSTSSFLLSDSIRLNFWIQKDKAS